MNGQAIVNNSRKRQSGLANFINHDGKGFSRVVAACLAVCVSAYVALPQTPVAAKIEASKPRFESAEYYNQFLIDTPNAGDRHNAMFGPSNPITVTDIRKDAYSYPDAKPPSRVKASVTIKTPKE